MINILKPLIKQFMPFAQERMGFDHPPRLFLRQDTTNADNPLGKTAYYNPQAKSVTLYITGRHPKDVMRSLSHELVHHKQNCNGQFDNETEMGEGYAQNNPHLRGMESEAYQMGNMCFRDWEDSIKGTIYNEHLQKGVNNTMSTKTWKNKELTTLLSEAWGFGFNLDNLNEKADKNTGMSGVKGDDDDDTYEGHFKPKKEGIEEEEIDESRGLAKRRGRPMSKSDEEAAGYDPDAEVWRRGGKGVEVQPGPEDDDDDDVPSPRSTRGAAPPPPRLREDEGEVDEGKYLGKVGKAVGAVSGGIRGAVNPFSTMKKGAKAGGKMGQAIGQTAGMQMTPEQEAEQRKAEQDEYKKKLAKQQASIAKQQAALNEDSGEAEAWHEWKNEHADDDHIREIEHHLRALKDDRDYERHGAEYDHDKYEDEGDPVDEGGSGRSDPTRMQGRDSARDLPDRKRPMEEQALRRMVRQTIRKIYQESKK